MSQDVVINGTTYPAVESVQLNTADGKKVLYFEGTPVDIAQETGDGETAVMSQRAVTEALNTLSNEIADGLTNAQISALNNMFKACAFIKEDVSAEYTAFKTAFGITDSGGEEEPDEPDAPEVTLTSISATYSGGDVAVGTAVTDLTGIVVTAHYSNGTSEAVTGYALSGTIAEGSNTVTVSYGGKTATFTVNGMVEETEVSNETKWTSGVAYGYTPVENEYPDKTDGSLKTEYAWDRTPYLYCEGASILRVQVVLTTTMVNTLSGNNYYNAFYDKDKNFIKSFGFDLDADTEGKYVDVSIPEGAAYFIASHKEGVFSINPAYGQQYLDLIPYE